MSSFPGGALAMKRRVSPPSLTGSQCQRLAREMRQCRSLAGGASALQRSARCTDTSGVLAAKRATSHATGHTSTDAPQRSWRVDMCCVVRMLKRPERAYHLWGRASSPSRTGSRWQRLAPERLQCRGHVGVALVQRSSAQCFGTSATLVGGLVARLLKFRLVVTLCPIAVRTRQGQF